MSKQTGGGKGKGKGSKSRAVNDLFVLLLAQSLWRDVSFRIRGRLSLSLVVLSELAIEVSTSPLTYLHHFRRKM